MKKPNDLLSVTEAAAEKGVSASAVYLAVTEGRLTAFRRNRPVLIYRRDVDNWSVVGHRPKKTAEGT